MQAFLHDVLGESVPPSLGEQVFLLAGGGRGVTFRELLTLLVLLTRGTRYGLGYETSDSSSREEKVRFIYGVLATESGAHIERAELVRTCQEWDVGPPQALGELFQVDSQIKVCIG